ncbi:unnamed protein product [Tilletia controversa]|nr:hypothetical protein CF336_g8337 [Tilletia laevis]KAE8203978.1 hypothetical protein CF328_g1345 [Tilletia controversa]KAE8245151.1 hypothetical protein A4X03_0g7495 [Tilletia caries]KAE8187255.1 hypothetical protein CF335_g7225 [Tilletia laevis]CAD6907205.1 unnamed protein product [Tilletia controversa]
MATVVSFTQPFALCFLPSVSASASSPRARFTLYASLQPASSSTVNMKDQGSFLHARPGQPTDLVSAEVSLTKTGTNSLITGQVAHVNSG